MQRLKSYGLVAVVFALLSLASESLATVVYDAQLDAGNFGNVSQYVVPAQGPGSAGANSCVPTSVANGIQYLQNVYSNVYGVDTIIPANKNTKDVAIDLANNWMNTTNASGTSGTSWIDDKYRYLEDKAANKTVYGGEYSGYGGTHIFITKANPTFAFLFNNLSNGAEIEVGIVPTGSGIGHALTLTALHWEDVDEDGMLDASEGATFDYIDPAGGDPAQSTLFQATLGGVLQTDYSSGYKIVLDVVASPVPEPGTLAGLGLGVALLLVRRRFG